MRHALYVMRDTDMFVRESPFPIPVGILYLWCQHRKPGARLQPAVGASS